MILPLCSRFPSLRKKEAHIPVLEKIEGLSGKVYNLGNGEGYSVFELVTTARKITKTDIPIRICPRRSADPAVLVASSNRAKSELGWTPEFPDLKTIIESAWRWTKQHPNGYGC